MHEVLLQPLSQKSFQPFGDIIQVEGFSSFQINHGMCERFHDLAKVETTGDSARVLISLLRGKPYQLPLKLEMVERHPLGSQAFMPLSPNPFLVVVAKDGATGAGDPLAFITKPGQGVNIHRNVWHGILTPLNAISDFIVVDRGGDGVNLEEHFYKEPFILR